MDRELLIERIRKLTHPLEPISAGYDINLQKIGGIRCVAFDFYGTMFISAVGDIGVDEEQQESSSQYFEEALRETGFEIKNKEAGKRGIATFEETVKEYVQAAQNKGIDHPEPDIIAVWLDVLTKLASKNHIEGEINSDTATRFGIEFEFRINDIWPVPGLTSLLNELLDQNLELGIISNSQFYTPIAFEALIGDSPTDFGFNPNLLIWSYKTGRKKPSQSFYRLFKQAAAKEGLQLDEVLYVGNDIRKDIKPAKALGMKTALYVGDRRSIRHKPDELQIPELNPNLIIDDLSQLKDCLQL